MINEVDNRDGCFSGSIRLLLVDHVYDLEVERQVGLDVRSGVAGVIDEPLER